MKIIFRKISNNQQAHSSNLMIYLQIIPYKDLYREKILLFNKNLKINHLTVKNCNPIHKKLIVLINNKIIQKKCRKIKIERTKKIIKIQIKKIIILKISVIQIRINFLFFINFY